MPLITRIELKSGKIYELGKTCPVNDQKEGSKGALFVGLIKLCPGEGEEDDEGAVSMPPYYEVWCVPKSLLESFFVPVQRALYKTDPRELQAWSQEAVAADLVKHKVVYSREIYLHQVAHVEKSWQTNEALGEIKETVIDPTFAPPEDGDDGEEVLMTDQPPPPNGEQKPAEPQAS